MLILLFKTQGFKALSQSKSKGSWIGALALFAYALGFSYAYIELDTGTGALILFGSVQVSMIAFGLFKGERFNAWQWCGLSTALVGLLYLLWPSISTPSFAGAVIMIGAGLAWGVYSIIGKGSKNALADTAFNFLRSCVLLAPLLVLTYAKLEFSFYTLVLAILSGAIASGLGYAVWYTVLPRISSMNAAVAQLSVPVIAALGGLLFVDEQITLRLVIASTLVLGGVYIVIKLKTKVR